MFAKKKTGANQIMTEYGVVYRLKFGYLQFGA